MGRGRLPDPGPALGPSAGPSQAVTADDPAFLALREGLSGRVLVGGSGQRYTVGSLRSEGGQGWVFHATVSASGHSAMTVGQSVIVKVLRADALSHEGRVRFHREAHVLRLLSEEHSPCAHVVRFHDYSEHELAMPDGGSMLLPFTVLEYVRGTSLDQELGAGPLPLSRTRTILRHLAAGLEYVHVRGVVHRDLKPANVLLTGQGAAEQAKITDFGLVRIVSPDLARTARIAGASVGYAPPEQYERGNARVSPRTDVFSLAAVAYEMLTGRPAYPYQPG
ncbi:MAG: serine/threonine protein kinase, partial [Proteobacteria bacterium]